MLHMLTGVNTCLYRHAHGHMDISRAPRWPLVACLRSEDSASFRLSCSVCCAAVSQASSASATRSMS